MCGSKLYVEPYFTVILFTLFR